MLRTTTTHSSVCIVLIFLHLNYIECLDTHIYFVPGRNFSIACNAATTSDIYWQKNGKNVTLKDEKFAIVKPEDESSSKILLQITNSSNIDVGNYSCHSNDGNLVEKFTTHAIRLPKITSSSPSVIRTKSNVETLFCVIEMYPIHYFNNSILWIKESTETYDLTNKEIQVLNNTHLNTTLKFNDLSKNHNGTYKCVVDNSFNFEFDTKVERAISLLFLDVPRVEIQFVKAVGAQKIYMNWTINDGNNQIISYNLQHMKDVDNSYVYYNQKINPSNTSVVLDNLEPNTNYKFKMSAKNILGIGMPHEYDQWVKTLNEDPSFVPIVEVKGNTHTTITIGWAPPPSDLIDFIQYYEVIVAHAGENSGIIKQEAIYPQNSRNLPYMFEDLTPATEHNFKVRACSEWTQQCGNWSDLANGTTSDWISSVPKELKVKCQHFNVSRRNTIDVFWQPPDTPNGKITSYHVTLMGQSYYRAESGEFKNDTWGPKTKNTETGLKASFENIPSNTNYTIQVAAFTRSKKKGEIATATCQMEATLPDMPRFMWAKVKAEEDVSVFKLFLSRINERNGAIYCYKIYIVRLGAAQENILKQIPENLNISTYHEVHSPNNTKGGAYLAEIFASEEHLQEIYLGDGKTVPHNRDLAPKCLEISHQFNVPLMEAQTMDPSENSEHVPVMTIQKTEFVDGLLDKNSNYTGFVEVVAHVGLESDKLASAYSSYFPVMDASALIIEEPNNDLSLILNIVIQILCGLILIVLLLLMSLCLLHKHYSKNLHNGEETISLRDSLSRALCGGRGTVNHRHLVGSTTVKPPILPPINKEDLLQAYQNRHKDSDYGFQHEFELLPDKFSDRTTKNSEAKENLCKNRYPDIKSYDQTRVKLQSLNGMIGSDYINANFVIGYKERKKFICAQGPMESTVNDFWRMIWEQHLEIIVMLTNLEEYNKTKCAKYWPENSDEYGEITVTFQSETYYCDYLVRELKVTKRSVNTNGGDDVEETRYISQYHYLAWKDFMAPEHPQGITKFIKRINSEYSLQRGPILVHCSAGVGRTGTFVALDSLTQQLDEEGQVSIFNTICDMRYQRNFLVQSLKQYIFLYKSLTDIALYGDTELEQKSLSATVENLKQKANEGDKCKLELQFEKLKVTVEEFKKTTNVGVSEEHKMKNRSESCIPFDRSRVILAPIPGRDNMTYINASFIDGYDEHNNFIITQDPMESTIYDFWRMISEQRIRTIVMISEIGDGSNKCPRYWDDDEISYDNILVKYIQSEGGPYYTRREFTVTNCKVNDTIQVTQFQYQGWPTVEGEVPEVTRGMIEIVNQAQKHNAQQEQDTINTIAVHCNLGTDKSSIFVAMCILVMQLKTEKRIDICTVVRKLRAQRHLMIDTYAQYEFLHRAIVNYADLFKISLGLSPEC